jgi:enoyl-CoA hydratase/carnithine racemase
MSELVLTDLVDGVGVISYNRPDKHNALNDALVAQYTAAVTWALGEPDVRCVVLRGEGPSFSSGRDVSELGHRPGSESDFTFVRRHQETTFAFLGSPKPIIAAVKGYALGGAFERCLAADIRVGSPDAVMGLPEILFGILPDTGGTQLLTALVGPGRAKELILTGRRIGAGEALAWGILNRVVPLEDLDATVMELASSIASKAPLAVAMGKQLVDQCWADAVQRGIRAELVAQTALFTSEDYQEARAARREGRPPRFIGK